MDTPTLLAAIDATLGGRRLLFAAHHGSRLYGTATPQSDIDIRAVFVPTATEILTGRIDFSLDNNPQKRKLGLGDIDITAFSYARFLTLLGKFDVNAVEMLFASAPTNPALLVCDTPAMDQVRAQAHALIGMAGSSPIGHARSVVGAMAPDQEEYVEAFEAGLQALKAARDAAGNDSTRLYQCPGLLTALRAMPRTAFQAQRHASATFLLEEDIDPAILAAGRWPHHTLFIKMADRMVPTTMTLREAITVLEKPLNRMRGEQATRRARQEGTPVHTKDLYHAIRILTQYVEIQRTGRLVFPRPNADTLAAIRTGAITGPALQQILDDAFRAAQEALDQPPPFGQNPDVGKRTEMIVEMHLATLMREYDLLCAH